VRVVLVDDHPVVRRGLAALLDAVDGLRVVGQAGSALDAVREVQLSRPDVVVMDLRMPGLDGVEATRRLAAAVPDAAVVVLTMDDDPDRWLAALAAGARGVLLKGAEADDIVRAIEAAAAGQLVLGPEVAQAVRGRLARPAPGEGRGRPLERLSGRERDVLALMAQGLPSAAIAARLGTAPKTVSNHASAILAKLGVATRAEAVRVATEAGLTSSRDG